MGCFSRTTKVVLAVSAVIVFFQATPLFAAGKPRPRPNPQPSTGVETGPLAGVGAAEITPPEGLSIGGYGFGERRKFSLEPLRLFSPSLGSLDPLRAKALVLSHGDQKIVMISLDVLLLAQDTREAIINDLQKLGFVRQNIFISAVHTHSGLGAYSRKLLWEYASLDYYNITAANNLLHAVHESVTTAMADLQPAKLQKSYFDAPGIQTNRSVPNGPMNPRARVLYVQSEKGEWLGGVVNFAIHGTAMMEDSLFFSSDVPGSIERTMESALAEKNAGFHGHTPVVLFISSAAGDIDPKIRNYDFVIKAGQLFTDAAMAHFYNRTDVPMDISVKSQKVTLPYPVFNTNDCATDPKADFSMENAGKLNLPMVDLLPHETVISQISVGNMKWLTWPGELTTLLHESFFTHVPNSMHDDIWFLALTNDYLMYFVRPEDYKKFNSVENCLTVFGPNAGVSILNSHAQLLGLPN